ncbi:bifunctional riboflavin kinase/FAD synthetase [Flavobacteriaceae bacterium]|nr:bifunctional riboflavin kinase/FAD synthetase [Flavobacteriaceae bacterium]MDA8849619.1 bifunctional riboflavin kinase/FAD synthetase [Flavobacteriaceae bacterium]MDB4235183.1 bifunctional riboflavin kinase/FAD synthetase [bacterium]
MKVVQDIQNYSSDTKSILTIGTFDGVHVGHQKIIKALVKEAHNKKLLANVLTFFPHPRMVLQKDAQIKLIDTLTEKETFLRELGVDTLIIHPFSKEFSRLSALEFTRDILVNQLKISELFIGYDHRFGKNREATVADLTSFGKTYDFKVNIIPAQDVSAITVSSTKIRTAILDGDFIKVVDFLGRFFQLSGTVTKGQSLGRTINFPTANLLIDSQHKIIPPKGVYLVSIFHHQNQYYGMMNIGTRPTLNGDKQTIEVHIFEFNKNIYSNSLTIHFIEKIRDEQKFESFDALKKQLIKDKEICKRNLSLKGWN